MTDVPQMTADASGLTGTTPTITIATTLQGDLFQAPFNDARRSATNTNDLRGKVLRIKVNDDGSYSIPAGNLFAPGTPLTRPEIYAMGFRNPFRIQVDENDVAYVTDYSPDSTPPTPLPRGRRHGASGDRPQAGQLRLAHVLQDRPPDVQVGLQHPDDAR